MAEDFDLSGYTLFERQSKFYNGFLCVYCKNETELIESKDYYRSGIDYGLLYRCKQCDAHVGCHAGNDKSLGTVATKRLRYLRHQAHGVFDPLWKKKKEQTGKSTKYVRGKAYNWMAKLLGIEPEAAHIGYLGIQDCQKLIEECKKYYDTPEKTEKRQRDIKWNADVFLFNATDYNLEIKEFKVMNTHTLEIKHTPSGKWGKFNPKTSEFNWSGGKKWVKVPDIEQFLENHFK